jgi:hypothetical protein
MNNDDIDVMLREYAPRWRTAQPPPPTAEVALRVATDEARRAERIARVLRLPRGGLRWLPVVAAAVSIGLVAGGIGVVRHYAQPSPAETPSPSTSPGLVPWRELPQTGTTLPTVVTSPSPDPSLARTLPPCRAEDLRVSAPRAGAAGGTRTLTVEFRAPARACRLDGYPSVRPLDAAGRPVAVPVELDVPEYGNPVALGGTAVALLELAWTSSWCADEVDVATLRLALREAGGTVAIDGFGRSQCYGVPDSGTTAPIRVAEFRPEHFTPGQMGSQFDELSVKATLPATAKAGEVMRFRVTLTAPADHDVVLDPCPDFSIAIGNTSVAYALNCAAVAYRDAAGRPYLPAGVPVAFAMQFEVPPEAHPGAKVVWQLRHTAAVGGGIVEILVVT